MFLAREQRVRRWWLGFLIYQFFIWTPFSLWFLQAHRLQPVHAPIVREKRPFVGTRARPAG